MDYNNVYGGEEAYINIPNESERDRRIRLRNAEFRKKSALQSNAPIQRK